MDCVGQIHELSLMNNSPCRSIPLPLSLSVSVRRSLSISLSLPLIPDRVSPFPPDPASSPLYALSPLPISMCFCPPSLPPIPGCVSGCFPHPAPSPLCSPPPPHSSLNRSPVPPCVIEMILIIETRRPCNSFYWPCIVKETTKADKNNCAPSH